jgi:hypothetical protein
MAALDLTEQRRITINTDIIHPPISLIGEDSEKKKEQEASAEKNPEEENEGGNTEQKANLEGPVKIPKPRYNPIPQLEPCLVTGIPFVGNQKAHWINAVRHKQNKDIKLSLVRLFYFYPFCMQFRAYLAYDKFQERRLCELRLVPKGFLLNHPSNLSSCEWKFQLYDQLFQSLLWESDFRYPCSP